MIVGPFKNFPEFRSWLYKTLKEKLSREDRDAVKGVLFEVGDNGLEGGGVFQALWNFWTDNPEYYLDDKFVKHNGWKERSACELAYDSNALHDLLINILSEGMNPWNYPPGNRAVAGKSKTFPAEFAKKYAGILESEISKLFPN